MEEEKGSDGVHLEMSLYLLGRYCEAGGPVVGDTGIGDHDIKVCDGVLGESGNSLNWVGGRYRVDLHYDDLAARAWDDGVKGCSFGRVADGCDDDVVGTLGVDFDETEADP